MNCTAENCTLDYCDKKGMQEHVKAKHTTIKCAKCGDGCAGTDGLRAYVCVCARACVCAEVVGVSIVAAHHTSWEKPRCV